MRWQQINLIKKTKKEDKVVNLLSIGRLVKNKNFFTLLDAVNMIRNKLELRLTYIVESIPRVSGDRWGVKIRLLWSNFFSVQRLLKIIGIFIRLYKRDGKYKYIKYIPNTWKILDEKLKYNYLDELRNILNQYCNKNKRKIKIWIFRMPLFYVQDLVRELCH